MVRPMLDEGLADAVCSVAVTELSMSERHFDDVAEYIDGCLAALERKQRQQALGELIGTAEDGRTGRPGGRG